jgi:hypothetical protein
VANHPGEPANRASLQNVMILQEPWRVRFDSAWGGPTQPVTFNALQSWTDNTLPGIKYYSGTAVYQAVFNLPLQYQVTSQPLYLNLGTVKYIARVTLNGRDLGVVWTAPWQVQIPPNLLKTNGNQLQIEVTNTWRNRLIGDEQEPDDCEWLPSQYMYNSGRYLKQFPDWFLQNKPRPSKGRYCFTTWDYFDKNSPLMPSGLIGPVKIVQVVRGE